MGGSGWSGGWSAAERKDPAGITVEDGMGGGIGAGGKPRIVAEIALQENIDGFFQGAVAFAQIAGEPDVELGAPVGFHENEAVEFGTHRFMRGDFAVGDQDAGGRDLDFLGNPAGWEIEDGLDNGVAAPESGERFSQAGEIVGVGMGAVTAVGRAAVTRQAEVVERQDAGIGQMVAKPAGEGAFSAAAGAADAEEKRVPGRRGFVFDPAEHTMEALQAVRV